jgi:hypothetical protein
LDSVATIPISQIAKALYTINRRTKIDKKAGKLYGLKKEVIEKLIQKGYAEKVGLQLFAYTANHPPSLTVLVEIYANSKVYYFHTLPNANDLLDLPHIGINNPELRNPRSSMPLNRAKQVLAKFCGHKLPKQKKPIKMKKVHKGDIFKSSFLD